MGAGKSVIPRFKLKTSIYVEVFYCIIFLIF